MLTKARILGNPNRSCRCCADACINIKPGTKNTVTKRTNTPQNQLAKENREADAGVTLQIPALRVDYSPFLHVVEEYRLNSCVPIEDSTLLLTAASQGVHLAAYLGPIELAPFTVLVA